MKTRPLRPDDYERVIAVVDDWWGGRPVRAMLPRLFFDHFAATSLVAEEGDDLLGILIGFLSPGRPTEAYVHFTGVSPAARGRGIGRLLYVQFFGLAAAAGGREVRCVTSPLNSASVAFHRRLGFEPLPGDAELDGVSFQRDYDGPGEDRVRFRRILELPAGENLARGTRAGG